MYIPADPKIWERLSKDKLLKKPKFWIPILGGFVLVHITPEDIFQRAPFLDLVVYFYVQSIPSVEKWVERSCFPSATLLLLSYLWTLIPYYFFTISKFKKYELTLIKEFKNKDWKRHFLPIRLFTLFIPIFSIYYLFALPESESCTYLCIYKSRNIQFAYFFCASISISGLLAYIFWWLKNFKMIHLSKTNGERKQ